MSSKEKPLSRIDVAAQPSPPGPAVNRVRFNPYTGALLKSDQPSFGKYSMFVTSGPKVHSSIIKFNRRGSPGVYNIQIPIPYVTLVVKNPNFEIKDAVLYLALDDNEFEDTTEDNDSATIRGKYVKQKIGVIVKDQIAKRVTVNLNPLIESLFRQYTIEDFLELITGEPVSNSITLSEATILVRRNLSGLAVYAEASFSNTLEDNTEGFLLRNKIISGFVFDPRYLDNPEMTLFKGALNSSQIDLTINYKSLKKIQLDIYASSEDGFTLDSRTFVKTINIDATTATARSYSVPLALFPAPLFNADTAYKSLASVVKTINSRKYIALKISKVVTTANIDITNPAAYFKLDLTRRFTLPSVAPKPNHATSLTARFPYVLNLITNHRAFYVYYNEVGTNLDADLSVMPKNIKGFVLVYINSAGDATNTQRFYPISAVEKVAGQYSSTTKVVTHYLRITDFFKDTKSAYNTYKLNIPYANEIRIYPVDNYYQAGNTPLAFANEAMYRYDLTNYLSDAFRVVGHNLVFNKEFIRGKDKASFNFDLQYVISPSVVYKKIATYRISYNHTIEYIGNDNLSQASLVDTTNTAVPGGIISTGAYSAINTTYKFRAIPATEITGLSPFIITNSERVLGVFTKSIDAKGVVLGS
jgi:hypothetical protein